MSNLIKKRKVFSSESESEEEEQLRVTKPTQKASSKEPNLVKKLKKSSEDLDGFEKKIEVVNQINAIKKDSLMKFLEEEDQKLSAKKRQLKTVSQQEAESILDILKKEEDDIDGRHDSENDVKQEDNDEEEEEQSDVEDSDDENVKQKNKVRRIRNQSYDQDSTNDNKENSFDGFYAFKDDDDFYIQANKNRQQESQQEKEIIKLVNQRSGKIISRSRGYIFTVICFKNHVFDADSENIIKKWCPQCNILHQEFSQYALSQQGELESEFFQPKLNFRCKFYHRWTASEANCIKQKVWCPKCPEVLNLMINHHHRGSVNDQEKIEQIFEQAEVIADGYQVTNPQQKQAFDLLKDMYFIILVPLPIYSRYLERFKLEEQAVEFKKKLALMHPDNNPHPLAEKVTEKLYKMFEHLLESSEDEDEENEEKHEKKQTNKQ